MSRIKEKKPKPTNPQNQQTTRWKSHLFSIPGRLNSRRNSFAQILPRFPVPTSQLFKKKYNPSDGQDQMLSSRSKAISAGIWEWLEHIPVLPTVTLQCRIWVTLSDTGPFIMNPSITNQAAMWRLRQLFLNAVSYNGRMSICRSVINLCLLWNLCLCKIKGNSLGNLGTVKKPFKSQECVSCAGECHSSWQQEGSGIVVSCSAGTTFLFLVARGDLGKAGGPLGLWSGRSHFGF